MESINRTKYMCAPAKTFFSIVLLVLLTGCRFFASEDNDTLPDATSLLSEQPRISAKAPINLMPNVAKTDLNATGQKLESAGFIVMVKRDKLVIEKSGKVVNALPELNQSFQPGKWNHIISAQEPAAGTPLNRGTVILLTAGIHHGAGPFRPWMDAHSKAVNYIGEARCQECHTKNYCSDCHSKL